MPATFKFYIRSDRPNGKGECPIYLRITHNRKKKYHNTGIRISPSHWNAERQEVRRSHNSYTKLNEQLELIEEDAKQARRELARQKKVSANAIKSRIDGASRDNFFTLANAYIKELKQNNQFYTKKQTKVAFKKLKKFNGSVNLLFSEIDTEFLERFQSYMANEIGNKGSTIRKNMGAIRKVVKKAVKQHLMPHDPFEQLELPERKDPGYKAKLSYKQIQRMGNLELQRNSNRWHARNTFILSFYFCGMRFGDIASLRWKNVSGSRLNYKMNKTAHPINVKIPEPANRFLSFYEQEDKESMDFILPYLQDLNKQQAKDPAIVRSKISSWNALVNAELKKVAIEAEIDEKVSMHVARHSFASYGVSNKELSVYKMMGLLGHQSLKTTENYLKRIDVEANDEAMDEIF